MYLSRQVTAGETLTNKDIKRFPASPVIRARQVEITEKYKSPMLAQKLGGRNWLWGTNRGPYARLAGVRPAAAPGEAARQWTSAEMEQGNTSVWCVLSRFSSTWLCNSMDCSPPGSSVMGFSRQEYWSGLPFPPPGDLPDPGLEPASLMSPALAGRFSTTSATWEAHTTPYTSINTCAKKCAHLCTREHVRGKSSWCCLWQ